MGKSKLKDLISKTSSTYSDMSPEEAAKIREDVAKKIEYQKQFDAPEAPSRIYHGSQNKIDKFEVRPHYLAEDEPVVFGTPGRAMAISHLAPWRDSDFEQGTYNNDPTLHMTEQYPGAFEKVYKGRKGYLYELDPSNFKWGPQLMRSEFISKEVPEILNSEELDVYEAMLAEEAAGRLKIHRAKEKTAQEKLKSAVIIKGNPYYLEQGPDVENYANYYKEIEDELRKAGYGDITYDRGDDYTTPRDADLWVGHSRGAGRLRYNVPEQTKTLDITQYEDGIEEYKAMLLKEMKEKGYSSMREYPVEERTRPGPEHYTVTDRMREAIQKTASAQYRPRGTLILRNDKGQVYAGKADRPGVSPYYFPGGGIFEEEGVDRVPTAAELEEGMNREALEELGYAIKNYKPLANLKRTYSKEWQDKAEKKRGVRYLGENEYYATAELGEEDKSLYDVEGDAFTSGGWYDPLVVAKALEEGDPTSTFYDSNLEEAAMLRQLQAKTASMKKEAKTRFIKMIEKMVREGKKEQALEMLRKAEQAEGVGSYSARQIKGLTDVRLGRGQQGVVEHAFHDGKLVPTKRLHERGLAQEDIIGYKRYLPKNIEALEREAANSTRIENIVRQDADLSRIVQTPEFLAKNTVQKGLVGQGRASVQAELNQLRSIDKKHLTRQQKGRIAQLERAEQQGNLGVGQSMPMSKVETSGGSYHHNVTQEEAHLQRLRAAKAKEILEKKHNIVLTDLNPGAANENLFASTTGKPTILDFGIVKQRGWREGLSESQLMGYDKMVKGTVPIQTEAAGRTVESLVPKNVGIAPPKAPPKAPAGPPPVPKAPAGPPPVPKAPATLPASPPVTPPPVTPPPVTETSNRLRNALLGTGVVGVPAAAYLLSSEEPVTTSEAIRAGLSNEQIAYLAAAGLLVGASAYGMRKTAQDHPLLRHRSTLLVRDPETGKILAAKEKNPGSKDSPYYFPGGGTYDDEYLSPRNPSEDELLEGAKREALEELGLAISNARVVGSYGSELADWWKEKALAKRKVPYQGVMEHYILADKGKEDRSIYNTEGDAFSEGEYYNPEEVYKALHGSGNSRTDTFAPFNREQAKVIKEQLLSKTASEKDFAPDFTPEQLKELGAGALAAGALYTAPRQLAKSIVNRTFSIDSTSLNESRKNLVNFLKEKGTALPGYMGPDEAFSLTAKDGRKILVNLDHVKDTHAGYMRTSHIPEWSPNRKNYKGGVITLGDKMHRPEIFFHELGHATGSAKNKIPYNPTLMKALSRGGSAAAILAGLAGTTAKTKDEAENYNNLATAILAGSALNQAPILAEEARANLRARGLAKSLGYAKPFNRKVLIGSMASYALPALASLSLPLVNKALASHREDILPEKLEEKTASEKDYTKKGSLAYSIIKNASSAQQRSSWSPAQYAGAAAAAAAAAYGGYKAYQAYNKPVPVPVPQEESSYLPYIAGGGLLAMTAALPQFRGLAAKGFKRLKGKTNNFSENKVTVGKAAPKTAPKTAPKPSDDLVDVHFMYTSSPQGRSLDEIGDWSYGALKQEYRLTPAQFKNDFYGSYSIHPQGVTPLGGQNPLKAANPNYKWGNPAGEASNPTQLVDDAIHIVPVSISGVPKDVAEKILNSRSKGVITNRVARLAKSNPNVTITRGPVGYGELGDHHLIEGFKPKGVTKTAEPLGSSDYLTAKGALASAIKAASITSLRYPGGVSPRFQGYISQKRTKLTTPISDLPQPPHPANDSEETLNELLVIKMHMEEGKLPESLMILADREPEKIFHIACAKFGLDPKKEQASVIKEDFNKIAFDLKYIFKRPRPWSLTEHHGVNLNVTVPESADTPSYPSGHAMMGYGLAEFYKSHYPEYSVQWDKIADIIQHSRLQAGLHFPSDNKYAKDIVMEISKREKVASSKAKLVGALGLGTGLGVGGTMLATSPEEEEMFLGSDSTRLEFSPEDEENYRVLIEEQPDGRTWVERNLYNPQGYEVIFEPAHLYKQANWQYAKDYARQGYQALSNRALSGYQRARTYAGNQYARGMQGAQNYVRSKVPGGNVSWDASNSLINPYATGAVFGGFTGGMTATDNKGSAVLGGALAGALIGRGVGVPVGNYTKGLAQRLRQSGLEKIEAHKARLATLTQEQQAAALAAEEAHKAKGIFGRFRENANRIINPADTASEAISSAASSAGRNVQGAGLNLLERALTTVGHDRAGSLGYLGGRALVGGGLGTSGAMLAGHLISGDQHRPTNPQMSLNLDQLSKLLSNTKTAKDNHVEKRRKERAPHISKSKIKQLQESISKIQDKIPKGSHHIKLPNASVILKDLGDKHVISTVYGPNMKPPGKSIPHIPLATSDLLALAADLAL